MRRRKVFYILIFGTALLLHIVAWLTKNSYIGILGSIANIWCVSMIPNTFIRKKEKDSKKDDVRSDDI